MKNNTTKIMFPFLVMIAFIGLVSSAQAASLPNLYVAPTALTKSVGEVFTVNTNISASTTTTYAVEGTLVFNNLTCESIIVAPGLMSQSIPTCAKPYFLIGIPNGTMKDVPLLDIKVKGNVMGDATISLSSVDIIGQGKSISTDSIKGTYSIVGAKTNGSGNIGYNSVSQKTSSGKIENAATAGSVAGGGKKIVKEDKNLLSSTPELIEANNQVASAGSSISEISIIWILIVIIILLSTYITLRELSLRKKSK